MGVHNRDDELVQEAQELRTGICRIGVAALKLTKADTDVKAAEASFQRMPYAQLVREVASHVVDCPKSWDDIQQESDADWKACKRVLYHAEQEAADRVGDDYSRLDEKSARYLPEDYKSELARRNQELNFDM